MSYIRVRNWAKFQHYKNRRPPWIKFYVEALDDHALQNLSIETRFLWPNMLLLAAIYENRTPNDPNLISRRLNVTPELVIAGIEDLRLNRLITVTGGASNVLAHFTSNSNKSALLETETYREETETEKELEKETPYIPLTSLPVDNLRLVKGA